MVIKINGKEDAVGAVSNLAELILCKWLSADRVVVEHNFRVIFPEDLAGTGLRENDNIEIVSFVGGG